MRLPNIVAIDGLDASGKATQAKMLADYLDTLLDPRFLRSEVDGVRPSSPLFPSTLRVAFPNYETLTGKLILSKLKGYWKLDGWKGNDTYPGEKADEERERKAAHANAEALVLQSLMLTNRFEVADEIERANVVEGRNVVLDRYWASGIAYGMADGLDYEWLMRVHTRLPKAHHVFIDIPVEESFKRRPKREDKYEADGLRLERARANYLHLFERHGVDTSYWNPKEVTQASADIRTSAAGYYLVNGLGTPDEVHARVKQALEL